MKTPITEEASNLSRKNWLLTGTSLATNTMGFLPLKPQKQNRKNRMKPTVNQMVLAASMHRLSNEKNGKLIGQNPNKCDKYEGSTVAYC